jgi:hypothetical protein
MISCLLAQNCHFRNKKGGRDLLCYEYRLLVVIDDFRVAAVAHIASKVFVDL